uniref:(northern house mosquito) hypothetical protein n=1 Tax=Culex pipiens TaxID=7175 RepID=A0A8D8FZM5_CULPI
MCHQSDLQSGFEGLFQIHNPTAMPVDGNSRPPRSHLRHDAEPQQPGHLHDQTGRLRGAGNQSAERQSQNHGHGRDSSFRVRRGENDPHPALRGRQPANLRGPLGKHRLLAFAGDSTHWKPVPNRKLLQVAQVEEGQQAERQQPGRWQRWRRFCPSVPN